MAERLNVPEGMLAPAPTQLSGVCYFCHRRPADTKRGDIPSCSECKRVHAEREVTPTELSVTVGPAVTIGAAMPMWMHHLLEAWNRSYEECTLGGIDAPSNLMAAVLVSGARLELCTASNIREVMRQGRSLVLAFQFFAADRTQRG